MPCLMARFAEVLLRRGNLGIRIGENSGDRDAVPADAFRRG